MPTQFSKYNSGKWEGRLLIRDIKQHKSYVLVVTVIAVRPDFLRLEVVTPLGSHLASLVLNKDQLSYMLVKEKRFYSGRASERALLPLIKMAVDPRDLLNVFFDLPPRQKAWNCRKNDKGFLQACQHTKRNIKLSWLKRRQKMRSLVFTSPQVKIQMSLKGFVANYQPQARLRQLKKQKAFRHIKLR